MPPTGPLQRIVQAIRAFFAMIASWFYRTEPQPSPEPDDQDPPTPPPDDRPLPPASGVTVLVCEETEDRESWIGRIVNSKMLRDAFYDAGVAYRDVDPDQRDEIGGLTWFAKYARAARPHVGLPALVMISEQIDIDSPLIVRNERLPATDTEVLAMVREFIEGVT